MTSPKKIIIWLKLYFDVAGYVTKFWYFYERNYYNFNFIRTWPEKPFFFERRSWFKFNNLGLAVVMTLKYYASVAKGFQLKLKKFWGLIATFVEITGGKVVEGNLFCPSRLLLNKDKEVYSAHKPWCLFVAPVNWVTICIDRNSCLWKKWGFIQTDVFLCSKVIIKSTTLLSIMGSVWFIC